MKSLSGFWNDECGGLISAELVTIGAIFAVGGVTGLQTVSTSVHDELHDVARAIRNLDQSFSYHGMQGCNSMTAGSTFVDPSIDMMGDRRVNPPGGNHHRQSAQMPTTSPDSSEPNPETIDELEP